MTEEALKKQAIKYAANYPTSYGKGYKRKDLRTAFIAGHKARLNVTTISDYPATELQLFKAIDLLKKVIKVTWGEGWNYSLSVKVEVEEFLKETEV